VKASQFGGKANPRLGGWPIVGGWAIAVNGRSAGRIANGSPIEERNLGLTGDTFLRREQENTAGGLSTGSAR